MLASRRLDFSHIGYVAKFSDHCYLKILTPKQMLQRLALALAQVKASNTSKTFLNESRQFIYSLHLAKMLLSIQ